MEKQIAREEAESGTGIDRVHEQGDPEVVPKWEHIRQWDSDSTQPPESPLLFSDTDSTDILTGDTPKGAYKCTSLPEPGIGGSRSTSSSDLDLGSPERSPVFRAIPRVSYWTLKEENISLRAKVYKLTDENIQLKTKIRQLEEKIQRLEEKQL